jgi:MoxR-like ATPase
VLARELDAALAGTHTPVMVWGAPGVGKSDLVRAAATAAAVPVIDLRLSQLEPSDLRGIPWRDGQRVEWAVPAVLPDADRDGPRGVLFLDEINAALPAVTAAAYQLVLDRRVGDWRVPDGWAVIAAGNRQGDRGVTHAMAAPLANRFAHFTLEPHIDDWAAWAHAGGLDARLIAFLRFRPERLLDLDAATTEAAFPSPRTWAFAARALARFDDDAGLRQDAIAACVGHAAAADCAGFLRHAATLPDIDAIVRGEAVDVPAAVEPQYAVATALVRRVLDLERDGGAVGPACDHVLAYAGRLPLRELGLMLVTDLQRSVRTPLIARPAFRAWADGVADLLHA